MNLSEKISQFGADNEEIFGGRALADHLLSSPHIKRTTTVFGNPSQYDNDGKFFREFRVLKSTVASLNFKPEQTFQILEEDRSR